MTNEPIVSVDLQEDEHVIERELRRMDGYRQIYERSHPYPALRDAVSPNKKDLTYWKMMGVSASGAMISGVAGVLASAGRTIAIFALIEHNLLATSYPNYAENAGLLVGGMAMLVVEGVLANHGYNKGVAGKKIVQSEWGYAIAMIIAILAGLLAGGGLMPSATMENNWFVWLVTWGMIIATGLGIPALISISFENIGYLHNLWLAQVEDVYVKWDRDQKQAELTFRKEQEVWERDYETEYYKRKTRLFGDRQTAKEEEKKKQTVSIQQAVVDWLVQHNLQATEVGIGTQYLPEMIASEIGVESGPVRTALSRLRNKLP